MRSALPFMRSVSVHCILRSCRLIGAGCRWRLLGPFIIWVDLTRSSGSGNWITLIRTSMTIYVCISGAYNWRGSPGECIPFDRSFPCWGFIWIVIIVARTAMSRIGRWYSSWFGWVWQIRLADDIIASSLVNPDEVFVIHPWIVNHVVLDGTIKCIVWNRVSPLVLVRKIVTVVIIVIAVR